MLNIGLGEMIVVAGACLIVIGPRRLPEAARFVGHLYARLGRQVATVRSEIRKEMELEDIRRAMRETEESVRQAGQQISQPVESLAAEADRQPEDDCKDEHSSAGQPVGGSSRS